MIPLDVYSETCTTNININEFTNELLKEIDNVKAKI
jgi:hypothetical protein